MRERNLLLVISAGFMTGCIQISIVIGLLVVPKLMFNFSIDNYFLNNEIKQEATAVYDGKYQNTENNIFLKNQESENNTSKEVIIYNGITIDQGIKSNENIDNKAIRLTKNAKSDREKAKILYTWIGSNIKYDKDKAKAVINGKDALDMPESGAIPAFENKSGICFDKACLYVAMSRAIGLKVRLIGGQILEDNGQYTGHAWNQVYINEEHKWINVDTTFYEGGNYYFDSEFFDDHKVEDIAGEW
ncbi:transglutaminase-like domain-containing protein [Clostridium sp. C2-6-12]|uniref:transglutaminase-like domain-containing protein n=1 Tax=Clostridium sp. C2-6-12 TaxID=2698832 RepID=UPI00136DCEC0|nr:transglutaminase-like domain-containing protein [Clostridium sp. C2-6-12]